jgi:L-seryl-tRNA(Ser) seleniumtransferase
VLALRALARGREVVVSRGQLIEIGGSFRLPEIFEVSGARLREVGTTNRTRLSDYERAIGPETAALLRVHPSNYRVVGFTESVGIAELAPLAHSRNLKAIDDIGSGVLGPNLPPGVAGEPTATEGISAGADLVLGSGDKLLGGPQCGLMLGTRDAIARVSSDPLMRALRVDKMTLAALEATLRLALDPALAASRVPLWSFLTTSLGSLRDRAKRLADSLRTRLNLDATVVETTAYLGGGSVPAEPIPTAAVRVVPPLPAPWTSEGEWARALRLGDPPVVARVQGGAVLFDLRAVDPSEDERLLDALVRVTCGADDRASGEDREPNP